MLSELFWPETLEEWVKQGAPKEIVGPTLQEELLGNRFLHDYFQLGRWHRVDLEQRISSLGYGDNLEVMLLQLTPVAPYYEPRIISEEEHTITFVNGLAQTLKALKDDPNRMPMYLDWPVKDRASWNEYKKRLDPNTPERWPADWNAFVQKMNGISEPLALGVGGFYGPLREIIGSERILYMFYDDPGLIEDMMEQILYLETEVIKRVLKDIKVDLARFWEDMCYKAGPLISPAMVRKFMLPRYKKITDLLHSYGVDVIFLDSDGNLNELVPLWLEVGINFIWPFEVAAGNDAVAIRKKYGKDLIIGGTIDKRALIKGKEAIREEVMSKVPFLLETGGYFPSIDHLVPPDVTFENYCYFINLMREVAGLEKLSFH
jgi:uroporphyrinogen decarboxylase